MSNFAEFAIKLINASMFNYKCNKIAPGRFSRTLTLTLTLNQGGICWGVGRRGGGQFPQAGFVECYD